MDVSIISNCLVVEGEKGVKSIYSSQVLFQLVRLCLDLLRVLLLAVEIFYCCF